MRKFMLITNRYKDRDLTLSNEIVSYIQQKGGSAAICVSNVEDDNQKDFALSEIPADTECILVLGGDGTLIRAATKVEALQIPLTSGTDSRTILDMNGAEKLLGKGDMLFHPQGAPKPIRVQGAFVSDKEVSDVVEFIKEQNETASYNEEIVQKVDSMQASSGGTTVSISDADAQDDGRDAYFDEAAQIIVDKEKASIGMLQRYLKVGFNRAARIMDQLEEAGIVGPEEGTKPRKVLMTSEELQAVKEDL